MRGEFLFQGKALPWNLHAGKKGTLATRWLGKSRVVRPIIDIIILDLIS